MKTLLAPAELFRICPTLPGPVARSFVSSASRSPPQRRSYSAGADADRLLLTALTASGVVAVMIGAFVSHVQAGHIAKLPLVIVLGVLAGFVAWARFTRARVVRRELRAPRPLELPG